MVTPSVVAKAVVGSTPASGPLILLVEDESVVREVTRQVLEHAGYQVLESDGPREAMRLAEVHTGRIALLLSDVVMPGMSGIDLARRIQKTQPRLATVFMSGYANPVVMQKAEPLSSYIQKPFSGGGAAGGSGRGAGEVHCGRIRRRVERALEERTEMLRLEQAFSGQESTFLPRAEKAGPSTRFSRSRPARPRARSLGMTSHKDD